MLGWAYPSVERPRKEGGDVERGGASEVHHCDDLREEGQICGHRDLQRPVFLLHDGCQQF